MEQHPVPQNVTTFQFKLIGDITLKQFAYVAAGIIIGYILFRLGILPGLIRYPLAIASVLLGIGLAFVPIEERPLDRWLTSFIKSIYMPTQFVWKKSNAVPEALVNQQVQMQTVPVPTPPAVTPTSVAPAPKPPTPVEEKKPETPPVPLQVPVPVVVTPTPPPKPVQAPPTPPRPPVSFSVPPPSLTPMRPVEKVNSWTIGAPPTPAKAAAVVSSAKTVTGKRIVFEEKKPEAQVAATDTKQIEQLTSQYQELEQRLNAQMQAMQQELQKGNVNKERFMELQQLLSQLLADKERMSNELVELRKKLSQKQQSEAVKPTQYTTPNTTVQTTVKMVAPNMAMQSGLPQMTTYPNVITGIVKDSQGNLLPSIILTVKDKDGLPVRALKTNKIGQFAASTPLGNGTYIIEAEDPKKAYRFERVEVTLSNQVLPPLEISAISEKDVMREKLSQEIFGKNNI